MSFNINSYFDSTKGSRTIVYLSKTDNCYLFNTHTRIEVTFCHEEFQQYATHNCVFLTFDQYESEKNKIMLQYDYDNYITKKLYEEKSEEMEKYRGPSTNYFREEIMKKYSFNDFSANNCNSDSTMQYFTADGQQHDFREINTNSEEVELNPYEHEDAMDYEQRLKQLFKKK